MAYEPTIWEDGDVITAEKMNKIENRIQESQNNVFVINITLNWNDEIERNVHYQDVLAAYNSGKAIIFYIRNIYNTTPLCIAKLTDGDGGPDYFNGSTMSMTYTGINSSYQLHITRYDVKLDSTDKMSIKSTTLDVDGSNLVQHTIAED